MKRFRWNNHYVKIGDKAIIDTVDGLHYDGIVTDIEKYSDAEADVDVVELNEDIVISVDEIEFMKNR